jgi:hypothetical protein
MAIVRSLDGRYFDVPDKDLDKCLVPADKVREKLEAAGVKGPISPGPQAAMGGMQAGHQGGDPSMGPGAQGGVEAYNWCPWWNWYNWRNWCNFWRNCGWHNHWCGR